MIKKIIKKVVLELANNTQNIMPEYLVINGEKKPTKNSNGTFISDNEKSIENFYKWFDGSKMVDSKKRPIVFYHISTKVFNTFAPSIYGKMGEGIYFTSILEDIQIHNKYSGSILYKCYLKISNPVEIEHPFSKITKNGDGIIAFSGKNGEEVKVYSPSQIKSIDNYGEWSVNDNNIYM